LRNGLLDGRTLPAVFRSLLILCLLAAACSGASLPPAGAQEQALEIHSRALLLRSDEPAATSVGRLLWRGGISMRVNSRSFGGWSDLHVASTGGASPAFPARLLAHATIDYTRGSIWGVEHAQTLRRCTA
jgi:hypothetical protein